LESALSALRRQIELELALAREWKGDSGIDSPLRAGDVVNAFAAVLPRVRAFLDSDLRAAFGRDPPAKSIDEIVFCFPGFGAIARHRLVHALYRLGVTMLARIIAEEAHSRTGIDIHPGAELGERFFIDHGTGVVIGETAIVGRNMRLYQAVTLGAKRFEADPSGVLVKNIPRHPIVEDDVVIYAGATVLGRVTIGKGSSTSGNVWLTRNVPPGSNVTQPRARNETFDGGAGSWTIHLESKAYGAPPAAVSRASASFSPTHEAVFQAPCRGSERTNDAERRIAKARRGRLRN
jgi:serine O-acetyltransferase